MRASGACHEGCGRAAASTRPNSGSRKASVLPEPVCATHSTSRPSFACLIASTWIAYMLYVRDVHVASDQAPERVPCVCSTCNMGVSTWIAFGSKTESWVRRAVVSSGCMPSNSKERARAARRDACKLRPMDRVGSHIELFWKLELHLGKTPGSTKQQIARNRFTLEHLKTS